MISRSLGPKYGGMIGLLFSMANAVAIAIYCVGFAEALQGHVGSDLTPDGANDIRVYSLLCLVVVFVVCLMGVDWVIKVQLGLLGLLILCIIFVLVGVFLEGDEEKGFSSVSGSLLRENWGPAFEEDKGFVHALGIFFPAATGIMAGANISGELRKPQHAIPWGTLYAVGSSTIVYILLGFALGASCQRVVYEHDGEVYTTYASAIAANYTGPRDSGEGLRYNFLIMVDLSPVGQLIYLGIYAATLSSAIASLVGAPRILRALAKDGLIPLLKVFANDKWKNDEPLRGYCASFLIALIFVLIANLNFVAPLITGAACPSRCRGSLLRRSRPLALRGAEFFMISYFFVNFACWYSSYTGVPGWRPTFQYYSPGVSAAGAAACGIMMVVINQYFAAVAIVAGGGVYAFIIQQVRGAGPLRACGPVCGSRRLIWGQDVDVNWGSAPEANQYRLALRVCGSCAFSVSVGVS